MFTGPFINPFASPKLINIATGAIASDDVQESLCHALDRGAHMADKFVSERLAPDSPKVFIIHCPAPT